MRSPGGSREYAVADERGGVVKKSDKQVDRDVNNRAVSLWDDYVGRVSLALALDGGLVVIVESATHDEIVLSIDDNLDEFVVYDIDGLDKLIKKLKKARRRILKRA